MSKQMTKEEALAWIKTVPDGTLPERTEYRKKFMVGRLAVRYWDDTMFTYGVEYGILIALTKMFNLTPEEAGISAKHEEIT